MPVRIQIKPLQDLRREFGKAGALIDELLESELDTIMNDAIDEAKNLVPVDTGRLRNSIGPFERSGLGRTFGSNVEYAGTIEFGETATGFAAGDAPDPEPQPYLRPAADKA